MQLIVRVSLKVATKNCFGGKSNINIQQFRGIILKQRRRIASKMI